MARKAKPQTLAKPDAPEKEVPKIQVAKGVTVKVDGVVHDGKGGYLKKGDVVEGGSVAELVAKGFAA